MTDNLNQRQRDWLTKDEPEFYNQRMGHDPYAIWVTRLNGITPEKVAARLLAYADTGRKTAAIIYLDGTRDTVLVEQMSARRPPEDFRVLR